MDIASLNPAKTIKAIPIKSTSLPHQVQKTVRLIARGIKSGSIYPPIHEHAARIATTVPGSKNYIGQLKALYDDFTQKRWTYVHDPVSAEWVTVSGKPIWNQIMGIGTRPNEKGWGDCDDATVAMGAMAETIGMPVRIVTIATPSAKRALFSHVYPEIKVPKIGWVSVDPVGYPKHPMGWASPYTRKAIWDLNGNVIATDGLPKNFLGVLRVMEKNTMNFADSYDTGRNWQDLGLENYGLAGVDTEGPEDWSNEIISGFGSLEAPLGMIDGDQTPLKMEYDEEDTVGYDGAGNPVVRTKMLEIDPVQLSLIQATGSPADGCVALSDDGDLYQYDGMSGFFKKLRKRVRRRVRRAKKRLSKLARKMIKKLPGGKYLMKIYGRVKKIAMKIVKPLAKFAGKYAKKLAPIAALIPGYGPAIAAALAATGRIAKIVNKIGVKLDKFGRPLFKSGKQAKRFKRLMEKQASKMKRRGKKKVRKYARKLKKRGLRLRGTEEHGYALAGMGIEE